MGTSAPRPRVVRTDAIILILLILSLPIQAQDLTYVGQAPPPEQPLCLWYQSPARQWLEALPVGNGRIGGMVYGDVLNERIALNEDTLWSGGPKDCDNPKALEALPRIRQLILAGEYARAHELGKQMMGPYTQSYLPMGELLLLFDAPAQGKVLSIHDYLRTLDLDRGVATVRYAIDDVVYTREVFVSHPDQVLAVRLTASQPRRLSFTAMLGSKLHHKTNAKDGVLILRGKAPSHVDPNYYQRPNPVIYANDDRGEGMKFECHLRAMADQGEVRVTDGSLRVTRATSVTLLLSAATSFNGFDKSPGREGKDPGPDRRDPVGRGGKEVLR